MASTIELLVGEKNVDGFLKNNWGKKIYLNKNRSGQKAPFTITELESIILNSKLTSSDLRISSIDQDFIPAQYCDEKGTVDIQKAFFYFNRGSTIIVRSIENFSPRLLDLCFRLRTEFGNIKRIFINLYLTPENSQGFFHHYDTEDVFILQVDGEKEWSLYDAPYPLPLENHPFLINKHKPKKSKQKKLLLEEADILYIPRGVIHEARAQNIMSCHLTISIVPFTWTDIVTEYQKEYSFLNEFMRRSIPAKINLSSTYKLIEDYNKLNHKILKKVLTRFVNEYDSNLKNHFVPKNLLTKRVLALDDSATVTLNSNLFHGVNYQNGVIELGVARLNILLPIEAKSIIDYVVNHKKCQIKDIPTQYSKKDKFVILERLIRDLFLLI